MLPILLFILVALIRGSSFAIPIDGLTSSTPIVAAQGAKRIAAQIFQDGQIKKAEEARKQAAEPEARKQAAARRQDTDVQGKPFKFHSKAVR
jgi:hypothetical protein